MKISRTLLLASLLCEPVFADFQPPVQVNATEAVKLYQIEDPLLRQATLHYREVGSRQFMSIPFIQNGAKWQARLEGGVIVQPGLEWYVTLVYSDGSQKTDPPQYPRYNPKRLIVNAKPEISIRMMAEQTDPKAIRFEVSGELEDDVRILLDGQDVSYLVQREQDIWILDNQHGIVTGDMTLKVLNASGETLGTVAVNKDDIAKREAKDHELIVRGNAGLNLGGKNSSTDDKSTLSLNGNLHVESEYRAGDFKSHFSGINVNYQHDAEEEFTLSSGFLFTNSYRQHSLEFGDVSVSGASLVLSGFARRGLNATSEGDSWSGSLFNVRTSPVDGWASGVSFDERQTYGMNYTQQLGAEGKSSLQVTMVSGKLQDPQTDSVGSESTSPQSGDSAGVQLTTELAGSSIDVQLAGSQFDADTSDSVDGETDQAYEISLSRDIYGLASSLGYHHYGANYATIANPNFSNDREGLNLSLGSQIGFLGWQLSFSSTEDNVEGDTTRAVVRSLNSGINLTASIQNWPSITLGLNQSKQTSSNEASSSQQVDNEGTDISLGLSDQFGSFAFNWSSSLGELKDRLNASSDQKTSNHALTIGYAGDRVSVDLNLSQNRTESSITETSDLVNLSAALPLFSDEVKLQTQLSLQQNSASDYSTDNEIAGGSARVAWALEQIFGASLKSIGGGSLGLSYTYNRTRDQIDPSADSSDEQVMLEFSFGAPVDFEYNWQF